MKKQIQESQRMADQINVCLDLHLAWVPHSIWGAIAGVSAETTWPNTGDEPVLSTTKKKIEEAEGVASNAMPQPKVDGAASQAMIKPEDNRKRPRKQVSGVQGRPWPPIMPH